MNFYLDRNFTILLFLLLFTRLKLAFGLIEES